MVANYKELRAATDEELIKQFDYWAVSTNLGASFLREELHRRESDRQQGAMLGLTKQMNRMTIIILVLTVANVIATIVQTVSILRAAH